MMSVSRALHIHEAGPRLTWWESDSIRCFGIAFDVLHMHMIIPPKRIQPTLSWIRKRGFYSRAYEIINLTSIAPILYTSYTCYVR